MSFKVFYCRYEDDFSVDDAIDIETSEIADLAFSVLRKKDDFFGVVDATGTTFQAMRTADGYWAEVPAPDLKGSYGVDLDKKNLEGILKNLPERFENRMIPGGVFQVW